MPQSAQALIPSDTGVMNALLSDQFTQKLEALAQAKAEEYKANQPYPHIYFDNFLPVEVAEAALRDFPEPLFRVGFESEDSMDSLNLALLLADTTGR